MRLMQRFLVAAVLVGALVSAAAAWRQGDGIQTSFSASDWPALLNDLRDVNLERSPYHLDKRTRAYDHEARILTPFAKAALFVQADKKRAASLTYDELAKHLDPSVLLVRTESQHRAQKDAEGVTVAFKADGKVVEPVLEGIESTMYRTVGYYAEKMFVCQKRFVFNVDELKGARSLTLILYESDGKALEMDVDLAKLR